MIFIFRNILIVYCETIKRFYMDKFNQIKSVTLTCEYKEYISCTEIFGIHILFVSLFLFLYLKRIFIEFFKDSLV